MRQFGPFGASFIRETGTGKEKDTDIAECKYERKRSDEDSKIRQGV